MMRLQLSGKITALGVGAAFIVGCHSVAPAPVQEPPVRHVAQIYPGVPAPTRSHEAGEARAATEGSPHKPTAPQLVGAALRGGLSDATQSGVQQAAVADAIPNAADPATTLDLDVALRLAGVENPTINLAREVVRESLADQQGSLVGCRRTYRTFARTESRATSELSAGS